MCTAAQKWGARRSYLLKICSDGASVSNIGGSSSGSAGNDVISVIGEPRAKKRLRFAKMGGQGGVE